MSLVIFCLLFSSVDYVPFAIAWMELESIMLSEISQTVRGKYHMISPLTGISVWVSLDIFPEVGSLCQMADPFLIF